MTIWAQNGTVGIRKPVPEPEGLPVSVVVAGFADTDTLLWGRRAYEDRRTVVRSNGDGVRRPRQGRRRCMMPVQTLRQQTADIQRQRSTCRRATSGVLAA
ncbi:hypothetical protein Sfulv_25770 [Streptomyces fulvorobeus]|uniref:Uncharacterized protein n=1 Tax=Streptomyces fulvorobeus TaxID=284028 RepID=A0A7J0C7P3_9ACTN|nr:hypothetical protein Sfulv_25770 [Streptomyces fulvorobeus]